nr:hypothetical protein [Bacillaceae bacterium]
MIGKGQRQAAALHFITETEPRNLAEQAVIAAALHFITETAGIRFQPFSLPADGLAGKPGKNPVTFRPLSRLPPRKRSFRR